jgi:hypothetical protein
MNTLTKTELKQIVPAAFATEPSDQVSDKYSMVSTEKLIDDLMFLGWMPVGGAGPNRGDRLHGTHRINFRRSDVTIDVGGVLPELILYNNHAGQKRASLLAGFLRLICSNGLVASTGIAETNAATIHKGEAQFSIEFSISSAIKTIEAAERQIKNWQGRRLTFDEMIRFATQASKIRFGNELRGFDLLQVHRNDDSGRDLWTIFNVVQENATHGTRRSPLGHGIRRITSVSADKTLNQELWKLAEETYGNGS